MAGRREEMFMQEQTSSGRSETPTVGPLRINKSPANTSPSNQAASGANPRQRPPYPDQYGPPTLSFRQPGPCLIPTIASGETKHLRRVRERVTRPKTRLKDGTGKTARPCSIHLQRAMPQNPYPSHRDLKCPRKKTSRAPGPRRSHLRWVRVLRKANITILHPEHRVSSEYQTPVASTDWRLRRPYPQPKPQEGLHLRLRHQLGTIHQLEG